MRITKKSWFDKYDKISYGLFAGLGSSIIGFLLNYFFNDYLFTSLINHWSTFKKVDFEFTPFQFKTTLFVLDLKMTESPA